MVRRRQGPTVKQGLTRCDGLWRLEALAIAPTEDVGRYHQLIATHVRLTRYLVGIKIDHLDHPVGVCPAGGSNQIDDWLAADLHRRRQDIGDKGYNIGSARRLALIIHQPT